MQPRYVTLSSSGSSPWFQTDWWRNPIALGVEVVSNSTTPNWSFDVTMDDPTGLYPNPTLNPGQPAGAAPGQLGGKVVSVFSAASLFGSSNLTSTVSSGSAIGAILQPIAAWRITQNSTSGTITATVLQAGPR